MLLLVSNVQKWTARGALSVEISTAACIYFYRALEITRVEDVSLGGAINSATKNRKCTRAAGERRSERALQKYTGNRLTLI